MLSDNINKIHKRIHTSQTARIQNTIYYFLFCSVQFKVGRKIFLPYSKIYFRQDFPNGEINQTFIKSLILAQDERWRRG